MDAAGKDGTIEHVMSGVNPQGCQVFSYKRPSSEELDHGYLWRIQKNVPERGRIGIFNRSHYEDVLVSRVHPELLLGAQIPGVNDVNDADEAFWERRYRHINDFERYLTETGTTVVKFFLNVSKEEQRRRLLKRIDEKEKHWKFSAADLKERDYKRLLQPVIDGNEIMEMFNLKPSREVGTLKQTLKDAVLDDKVPNEREPLMRLLKEKAAEMGLA